MADPQSELSQLMRAAIAGDAGAYREVLERLAGVLRAVIRRGLVRAGRGSGDAEDVVQEALLAIHLKRHTWDETQALEPWARAIAHHKLVDHLRRKGFRLHLDIADYAEVLPAPPTGPSEAASDLSALLTHLPPAQRSIVEAMSIEGRSARETGDRLGMSEGAVRVALHRALKKLAAIYRQETP